MEAAEDIQQLGAGASAQWAQQLQGSQAPQSQFQPEQPGDLPPAAPQTHLSLAEHPAQEEHPVAYGGTAVPRAPGSGAEGVPAVQLLPTGILELPQGLPGEHIEGPKYKRGRGRSFFKEQPKRGAVCQVPGCDRPLHKLRDYYKRYKICPYHLELPCLVVEGQTIRFCQQCGRFQLLSDFEGDRRSCKRKLEKHNERRRKAEAEQKAQMGADDIQDSPSSTRGNKAYRPLSYLGGTSPGGDAYSLGPSDLLLGGNPGSRALQLATDPALQGLPPSLLEPLLDPAAATVDWVAVNALNALGGSAGSSQAAAAPPALPQAAAPVMPPEQLQLLPPHIQQLVAQQGAGIVNSMLLTQLQQLQASAPPPQPPQPLQQLSAEAILLGLRSLQGASSAQPQPASAYNSPAAMALSPAAPRLGLLGAAAQQPAPFMQQQQQQQQYSPAAPSRDLSELLRSRELVQQIQQAQQQMQPTQLQQVQQPIGRQQQIQPTRPQQQPVQPLAQQQQQPPQQVVPVQQPQHVQQVGQQQQAQPLTNAIPLVRSEPAHREAAAVHCDAACDPEDKAAAGILELARRLGISPQRLARVASLCAGSEAASAATLASIGAQAGPQKPGSMPGEPANPQQQQQQQQQPGMPAAHQLQQQQQPGMPPAHQLQQQLAGMPPAHQLQQQLAGMPPSHHQQQQQGSDSRGTNAMQISQPVAAVTSSLPTADSIRPASSGVVSSAANGSLQRQPSSAFAPAQQQPQAHASAFLPQQPPAAQQQQQQQQQQSLPRVLDSVVAAAAAAAQPPASAAAAASGSPLDLQQVQQAVQRGGLSPGFESDASLLLQLLAAAEEAHRQAASSSSHMHTVAFKLFKCTPDRLPKNMIEQLEEWMVQNPSLLEAATRPGCVHLTVSALMSGDELAALTSSFAGRVRQLARSTFADVHTGILAQRGCQAALVDSEGRQALQLDLALSGARLPEVFSVRPLAVTPGYRGPILVTGRHISGAQGAVFLRNGGHYPTTEVLGSGALLTPTVGRDSGSSLSWVLLRVPVLEEGCMQVEAQHNVLVSHSHSLLVLDDAAAVAELRQLELAGCHVADAGELLHRLGAVLRFGRSRWAGARAEPALLRRIAAVAQDLAATCILRRWAAVLRLVLPLACSGCAPEHAVAGIEACLNGIPLLHAAAVVGGAKVVRCLGAWAADSGYQLPLDACWRGGLTALHLAVLLRQPEEVALALTGLCPSGSQARWAAALCQHGGESPLALACHLDKRGLLRALCDHGVAEAAAMLAALELQDEPARRQVALPLGVDEAAKELDLQRRRWTKMYGSLLAEEATLDARLAPNIEHALAYTWPPFASAAGYRWQPLSLPAVRSPELLLRGRRCGVGPGDGLDAEQGAGSQSPSSVLSPPDRGFCLGPAAGDEQAAQQQQAQQHGIGGPPEPAWGAGPAVGRFQQGAAARSANGGCSKQVSCAQGVKHAAACSTGEAAKASRRKLVAEQQRGLARAQSMGGDALACRSSVQQRQPGRWPGHSINKREALACAALALVLCAVVASAPPPIRLRTQAWLWSNVVRAPLLFHPWLLLLPAVRRFCQHSRRPAAVAVHLALLGMQGLQVAAQRGAWLAGAALLAPPWQLLAVLVGLLVLAAQVYFALQSPTLLALYCCNVLLLSAASQHLLQPFHAG